MACVAGTVVLSVPSPVPPEQAVEPVTKLAALQSLHILPGTEHRKNWGGEWRGIHPTQSCSGTNWKALASVNTSNQPSSAEVVAPLLRAFFQVEASLCFVVGLEKSDVYRGEAALSGRRERNLEPVVGNTFLQEVRVLQVSRLLLTSSESFAPHLAEHGRAHGGHQSQRDQAALAPCKAIKSLCKDPPQKRTNQHLNPNQRHSSHLAAAHLRAS